MSRDGLLTVSHHIIESAFAWGCRRQENSLAYEDLLHKLAQDPSVRVIRAPKMPVPDTIYHETIDRDTVDVQANGHSWSINNSRPAFDAADFMRFGKTLLGQFSHITNLKGVEYLQSELPQDYKIEMVDVTNPHIMHIDTVILPLRKGLLIYHRRKVSEESLRKHEVLRDRDLQPVPFTPKLRLEPPSLTYSDCPVMNALVLDGEKVIVDATDIEFVEWMRELDMEPIFCPLRHVNSVGGAAHCATLDLVRLNQ